MRMEGTSRSATPPLPPARAEHDDPGMARPGGGNNDRASILQARRAQGVDSAPLLACLPSPFSQRSGTGTDRDHAGADRGGEEGRKGPLLHLDRPAAGREDREIVRGRLSRHRRARRAHRRRARVPAHRPGICEPHLRRRRGQFVGRRPFHRVEAGRSAGAVRARGRRQALSRGPQGSGRNVRELPRELERDRLQHQPGQARGGAEELRRPARSEMDGQDRQGASAPTAGPS